MRISSMVSAMLYNGALGGIGRFDTEQDLFWNFNKTEVPEHIMDKLSGKSVRGHDVAGRKQARKFIQLKQMISFVLGDSWTSFDKFCGYGCWCFPDGQLDIMQGKGQPLDKIDNVCFTLHKCYKCLEHDQCDYKNTGYTLNAYRDDQGEPQLECDQNQDSCRRNLCECDREMAYKLAEEQLSWNRNMHETTPGSDVREQCQRSLGTHVDDNFHFADVIKPAQFEDLNEPKVNS